MNYKPPHTVSCDELVGRLLQLWQPQEQIELQYSPAKVVNQLELEQDAIEGKLEFAASHDDSTLDTAQLQKQLAIVNTYLDFGSRLRAVLEDAIHGGDKNSGSEGLNIVFVTDERDIYQYREPFFTTVSAYKMAMRFGIEVPEWAPPAAPTDDDAGHDQTAAQSSPALSDDPNAVDHSDLEYAPETKERGVNETLFILATVFGSLLDKLVEDEHVESLGEASCIQDDGKINPEVIAKYIYHHVAVPAVKSRTTNSLADENLATIDDAEYLALGAAAHTFCSIAEKARIDGWVVFRDKENVKYKNPFLQKNRYVSNRISLYLDQQNALRNLKNASQSSIQHRLGNARRAFYSEPRNLLSIKQLTTLIVDGEESSHKRNKDST